MDWILCPSEHTKQDLIQYCKVDKEKVFVTYSGVSSKQFYPVSDLNKIQSIKQKYAILDTSYLIYVGAIEERKNIVQLISSFIELIKQEKISDLKLVLCGSVRVEYLSVLRDFHELMKQSKPDGKIIHLPNIPDEDLVVLYNGAFAFVNLSHYEGFGSPTVEAMQCRTPVIVSNSSAFPEIVQNAGLLIDKNDSEAFSQAILSIYSSSKRDALVKKGIKRAKQFYWENMIEKTHHAYQKALDT